MSYQHFSEMPVWQKAHELALLVYRVTAGFPREEQYSLTSQVRRAVVSVSSNIAEGFGRQGRRDKAQFYYNARGSLYEAESQLTLARDLGFLNEDDFRKHIVIVQEIAHELNKLIKTLIS
jgi:four helix bundle protein